MYKLIFTLLCINQNSLKLTEMKTTNSSGSLGYTLFISLVAACGGLLFGYDAVVVSGTNLQVMEQYDFSEIERSWLKNKII